MNCLLHFNSIISMVNQRNFRLLYVNRLRFVWALRSSPFVIHNSFRSKNSLRWDDLFQWHILLNRSPNNYQLNKWHKCCIKLLSSVQLWLFTFKFCNFVIHLRAFCVWATPNPFKHAQLIPRIQNNASKINRICIGHLFYHKNLCTRTCGVVCILWLSIRSHVFENDCSLMLLFDIYQPKWIHLQSNANFIVILVPLQSTDNIYYSFL